jgi:phosphate transport system substrate-binding protein
LALAEGRSQIAPMGAPFSPEQLRSYRHLQHADPVAFKVAHASIDPRARSSPIGIYVHPSNPIRFVTMDQLRQVFGRASSNVRPTWSMLGLGGEWASRGIDACGLAPSTALGQYMLRRLQLQGGFVADYLAFSESRGAVQEAARDRGALCFGDLNDATTRARRLAIIVDGGGTAHAGTRGDIHSGTYPLDRFLYIYVRQNAGSSAHGALICRYLSMVLSRKGQALLAAASGGYIPLNRREIGAERHRLGHIGCRIR